MADEDGDTRMSSVEDSDSSDNESQQEPVEWLATGREKRSTAGNRMTTLIQQEGIAEDGDDDLELLFAEDGEEDEGFEEADEDGSDVHMDSSSDDDEGPTVGAEDLEGEKELQQQAKVERTKKRKANNAIPQQFRKKVKHDPTAPMAATSPRPKKKSERASWIPTAEDAPTRASARGSTKEGKKLLHLQLLDREKQRIKQQVAMEKAAKKKEANKPKEVTQADRLAEAAKVEKKNSKSLNRWEEQEKAREEDQRAKLAALHNRKMEGPVITWWSGIAEWFGGKLKHVGKNITIEEKVPRKKKEEIEVEATKGEPPTILSDGATLNPKASSEPKALSEPNALSELKAPPESEEQPALKEPLKSNEQPESKEPSELKEPPESEEQPALKEPFKSNEQSELKEPSELKQPPELQRPSELKEPPAMDVLSELKVTLEATAPTPTAAPAVATAPASAPVPAPAPAPSPPTLAHLDGTLPLPGFAVQPEPQAPLLPKLVPSQTEPFTLIPAPQPPQMAEPPPLVERSTRNSLILENFDEAALRQKDVPMQIIFGRTFNKLPKTPHPPTCVITGVRARYVDPSSGLPYANAYAYREIQKLKRGAYDWSSLLQAYVGGGQFAARGVPPRFLRRPPTV